MTQENYIYIVFSATPYLMGRAIRRITGESYNHASIALDENLTRMYGFARRYYRIPLYGGFVKESHARYHVNGKTANIRLCRLPVTREQYEGIESRLATMHSRAEDYIYNHISALAALFHRPIPAKNAYTCVEFCIEILHSAGVDLEPGKFYSVGDVEKLLRPFVIYTGPMPDGGEEDAAYYAKRPVFSPTWVTLREIFRLLPRLGG